jgi:hypothetical protein
VPEKRALGKALLTGSVGRKPRRLNKLLENVLLLLQL